MGSESGDGSGYLPFEDVVTSILSVGEGLEFVMSEGRVTVIRVLEPDALARRKDSAKKRLQTLWRHSLCYAEECSQALPNEQGDGLHFRR